MAHFFSKSTLKNVILGSMIALSIGASEAKTLRIGMETTFAPFEFYNEKNELVGFDIDIANQICDILKETCEFQNLPFETLIGALKMRKVDIVISGIDITPERQAQVDFSQPYYESGKQYFLINAANTATTFDELKSKKIGVQNGTTQQKYLAEQFPNVDVASYAQMTMAFNDLQNGRIVAVLTDGAVAGEVVKSDPTHYKLLDETLSDPAYFGEGIGIAVRQGNTVLLDKINQALATMREDGSYQKIYDKWF